MGSKISLLTNEELEDYNDLTYLTRAEIIHIFSRFESLSPRLISQNKFSRIPFSMIAKLPELQNNPFVNRIGQVFSSEQDGRFSFEDFLDMASVFSSSAPINVKSAYAFRIYDFDEDGQLSPDDIVEMITRLTGKHELTKSEIDMLLEKIFDEADLDRDGMISPGEFEHVVQKAPDFVSSFSLKL